MSGTATGFEIDPMFEGRWAAVTGASGGLGLAICEAFARAGARVAAIDLDERRAQLAAARLAENGFDALPVAMDVADWASVCAGFERIGREAGGLDFLVNNAGVGETATIETLSPEKWQRIVSINLSGPFHCMKAAIPLLKARGGGSVVNIASVAGMVGIRSRPAYTASKHGVVGLARSSAYDLARHNIRVNAIAPGAIPTPMTQSFFEEEAFLRGVQDAVALGAAGTPRSVADAVLFLCSPRASFVNGVVLPVDGGFLAEKSFATNESGAFVARGE